MPNPITPTTMGDPYEFIDGADTDVWAHVGRKN